VEIWQRLFSLLPWNNINLDGEIFSRDLWCASGGQLMKLSCPGLEPISHPEDGLVHWFVNYGKQLGTCGNIETGTSTIKRIDLFQLI
jgi:hypothetical protein